MKGFNITDPHTATEVAYHNGYEKGLEEGRLQGRAESIGSTFDNPEYRERLQRAVGILYGLSANGELPSTVIDTILAAARTVNSVLTMEESDGN